MFSIHILLSNSNALPMYRFSSTLISFKEEVRKLSKTNFLILEPIVTSSSSSEDSDGSDSDSPPPKSQAKTQKAPSANGEKQVRIGHAEVMQLID